MNRISTFRKSSLALLALLTASAHAEKIYGATVQQELVSFDSDNPADFTMVGKFNGLGSTMFVRAIDFRPSDGKLFALGQNNANHDWQLYSIDLRSAEATAVGGTFTVPVAQATRISIDFNPVTGSLALAVPSAITNMSYDFSSGVVTQGTNFAFAAGDANSGKGLFGDLAYSNNVAGATSTTLYGYAFSKDTLATIGTANGVEAPSTGKVHTVGPGNLGLDSNLGLGFDISGATGKGYVSSATSLYGIDLATGATTYLRGGFDTLLGGPDDFLIDMSVAPPAQAVPEPTTIAALSLGALAMFRRRKHSA